MTDAAQKLDLGSFGLFGGGVTPHQAKAIEALGYGAVWVGNSPSGELDWAEPILENTTTLKVASAIVNIWTAHAGLVAKSFHRIERTYPDRFLLGIGHPEAHQLYRKPIDALNDYLDKLDEYGVPKSRRVLAAIGPQVLKLSARRSAGRDRFGQLRCRHRVNSRADHYTDLRGSQNFGLGFALVDAFGHPAERVKDRRPHAVAVLQHNVDGAGVEDIQLR